MTVDQIIQNLQTEITKKDAYIELLEKLNSQLSNSFQPINATIMILTALIALGAIVAGLLVYYLGKDYRKNARLILNREMEAREKKIRILDSNMSGVISRYEKRLNKIVKSKKKSTRREIEELKKDLIQIKRNQEILASSSSTGLNNSSYPNSTVLKTGSSLLKTCIMCGNGLPVESILNICEDCQKKNMNFGMQ